MVVTRFSFSLEDSRCLLLYQSRFKNPRQFQVERRDAGSGLRNGQGAGPPGSCRQLTRPPSRRGGPGAQGAASARGEDLLGAWTAGTHSGDLQMGFYDAGFKCPKNASFLRVLIKLED